MFLKQYAHISLGVHVVCSLLDLRHALFLTVRNQPTPNSSFLPNFDYLKRRWAVLVFISIVIVFLFALFLFFYVPR